MKTHFLPRRLAIHLKASNSSMYNNNVATM